MSFKPPRLTTRSDRNVPSPDPESELIPGLKAKHFPEFLELVRETRNLWSFSNTPKELAHRRTMSAHATKRRKREEAARLRSLAAES